MEKNPQTPKGKKRQKQGSISEESPTAKNLKLDSLILAKAKSVTQKPEAKRALEKNIAPNPVEKLDNGIQKPKKKKRQGNTQNNDAPSSPPIKKKVLEPIPDLNLNQEEVKSAGALPAKNKKSKSPIPGVLSEATNKYPILKNTELVTRFLKVPMTNNQKGRIRQAIKLKVKGTSNTMNPDIINAMIQDMIKGKKISEIANPELRRLRILYNLLKTVLTTPSDELVVKKDVKKNNNKSDSPKKNNNEKVKGPKRYVAFIGNLPLDINKEMIMEHFRELDEQITDVRIPPVKEGNKSSIAYIELTNEPSFELALSKHHSMMNNKRIKVLYSTQQNSKISKAEAKSTSAKLIALQKSGQLVGSTPQSKKRSHRRNIMKQAQAKETAATA